MSNIGSSKIAEMYIGNTKIARAYVGSDLVFQISQPAEVYDSYVIHLTWTSRSGTFCMAGLHINGVQATTSQVTSIMVYTNGSWNSQSSSNIERAIKWDNNDDGYSMWGDAININFTSVDAVNKVEVKTGTWYGGDVGEVTMHVAGVKDGVETDLGYTSQVTSGNIIYIVNI
jgi:hypothetical protein